MKQKNIIIACILASIGIRIFALFYFDLSNINYWEYGDIAQNILAGKGYSFYYEIQKSLCYRFSPYANVQPSAFMPPGYVFFITPFYLIKNVIARNVILIMFQHLISGVSIYILIKVVETKFSTTTSTIMICIGLLLPEFIVASHYVGPTLFYHLFLASILFFISNLSNNKNYIIALAVTIVIGIYFRSEMALLFIGFIAVWIKEKKWNWIIKSSVIVLLLLSPWVIRNYFIFNHFIPLTTNSGMNLYRGHNLEKSGGWPTPLDTLLSQKIIQNSTFEYALNQMYLKDAWYIIKQYPQNEIGLMFKKFVQFWLFDWEDNRAKSLLYLIPWMCILAMGIVGILANYNWQIFKYEYVFFICSTLTVIIFFPLLRYQTMMKFMLLPFAADGLRLTYHLFKKKIIARS